MKSQNKAVKFTLKILTAISVISFGADFLYHRHVVHPWEGLWGFYAIYGFVACVVLVLISKKLRRFLMRNEDYYD